MRLIEREVVAIKAAARTAFGDDAVVRLFGSRLDDGRRGGDIDLYIEMPQALPDSSRKSQFLHELYDTIGEREIDVLYSVRGQPLGRIEQRARSEGVVL